MAPSTGLRVLLALAGLLLLGCSGTSAAVAPYNDTLARQLMSLSGAAYCPRAGVENWSCSFCKDVPLFTPFGTAYNSSTDILALVGYKNDSNSVVVAFRGTKPTSIKNWLQDLDFFHTQAVCDGCQVHRGFWNAYLSVRDGTIQIIKGIITLFPDAKLVLAGHSLGGALAFLASVDFPMNNGLPVADEIYTYGAPRVGNNAITLQWRMMYEGGAAFRLTHGLDPVPHLPPRWLSFLHPPTEVYYDGLNTKYTVCDQSGEDPKCANQWLIALGITDHLTYFGLDFMSRFLACGALVKNGTTELLPEAETQESGVRMLF